MTDAFVERFTVEPTGNGILRGTRFAVKDLMDVNGRITGCGNPTWRATHQPAERNAAAVDMLLAAGARLVGKTRTDELAYSIEGRNFHEGAPRNPAAPQRLTGGSSSGSAAAVAGAEVDFALGTDTAGSVRIPAAWCGVWGLRPTHGRVPVAGLTPLAPDFDVVGWFARSAALMRRIGSVLLGGASVAVAAVSLVRDAAVERYAEAAGAASLQPAVERCAAFPPGIGAVSLGVDLELAAECLRVLQGAAAWRSHGAWIESNRPRFGPGVAERFAAARAIGSDEIRAASAERSAIVARLDAVLPPGCICCLPAATGPAPLRDATPEELGRRRRQLLPLTALASLAGRPQLTLPAHDPDGAPVGYSLLGWRGGDEALLDIAAALPAA